MVFKCQEDSFLKAFQSTVVRCEKTRESIIDYGKVSKFEGYHVILEDTILFPAGGGQPHDTGYLNSTEVVQVLRKGPEAVHFTKEPLEVGTVVSQTINWERRFNHMQQHSGQHLLSAILEREHSLPTSSWWLGAEESYVELDTVTVPDTLVRQVEDRCNELIRQALPVTVKFCKIDDPALDEAHTRGLPKDCTETIRVVCIENVDENMCCGTHVSNLSQLQIIKLLGTEPGKKGKTNLRFLVGKRVANTLQQMLDREKTLTGLLKNEPSKHADLVQKLQKNLKVTNKHLQNCLADLAQSEVDRIARLDAKPKFVVLHKKEATPEFNRAVCKGLESAGIFMFLTSEDPDKPREGQVMIQGPEDKPREGQVMIQGPEDKPREGQVMIQGPEDKPREGQVMIQGPEDKPREGQVMIQGPEDKPREGQVMIQGPEDKPREGQVMIQGPEDKPREGQVMIQGPEDKPREGQVMIQGPEDKPREGQVMIQGPEDKPREGQVMIQGPEEHCNALGSRIMELVKGKGAFKNGKFQGKAGDLTQVEKCNKLIEDYFSSLS